MGWKRDILCDGAVDCNPCRVMQSRALGHRAREAGWEHRNALLGSQIGISLLLFQKQQIDRSKPDAFPAIPTLIYVIC